MTTLSPLLYSLTQASSPRIVLALRPQDSVPDWITHVIQLGAKFQIIYQGSKDLVGDGTVKVRAKKLKLVGMSL